MANYLARCASPRVPDYAIIKAVVPTGQTLNAGDIVALTALDTTFITANNYQVFSATQPATANLGNMMAIVVNDGFETLADGRRPDGNPDYTTYTYGAGEVVTCVLLVPGLVFEISMDCVTNGTSAVAGDIIEPVNASYAPSRIAAATGQTEGTMSGLKVLTTKYFRMGGQFGGNFIQTIVAMAIPPKASAGA